MQHALHPFCFLFRIQLRLGHPPRTHAQLEIDDDDGGKVDGGPNLSEVVGDAVQVR